MKTASLVACLLVIVALRSQATPSAAAGTFGWELPELVGNYLGTGGGGASDARHVAIDMGMPFAQIDSVSLSLTGTHRPGVLGDLNSDLQTALPGGVLAHTRPAEGTGSAWLENYLVGVDGAYSITASFDWQPGSSEDVWFEDWLDGTIEFDFQATTPPVVLIYYLIDAPELTIDSAQLVIEGYPLLDQFMLEGDFNQDGSVDGADLERWETLRASAPSDSNGAAFLSWQRSFGAQMPLADAVPEPASIILGGWVAVGLLMGRSSRKLQRRGQ
jgi:hypothetical protein